MVDTLALGASAKSMEVQVLSPAPIYKVNNSS